jgi:hypothetical protein
VNLYLDEKIIMHSVGKISTDVPVFYFRNIRNELDKTIDEAILKIRREVLL